jgi:hypothetical protein
MRHAILLSFGFLVAPLAFPARAAAQPSAQAPADAESARADDFAHRANDLALKHQWAEAESLYREAWTLKQSYDIAGNLGIAAFALGKYRDAAEHLSFALMHFPANGKPEHRNLLREKLAKARAEVGARVIEVTAAAGVGSNVVAGAEVLVDGKRIGVSPLDGEVFLEPGTRTIVVRYSDYETATRTIDVGKGTSDTVTLALRPAKPPPWKPGVPLIVSAGVLAAAGIAAGLGLTVAANGKAADRAGLLAKVGESGCAHPSSASAADCSTLLSAANSQSTLSNGAVAAFATGGALALVTVGLATWANITRPPPRDGVRIQVAPALGAAERGVVVSGTW